MVQRGRALLRRALDQGPTPGPSSTPIPGPEPAHGVGDEPEVVGYELVVQALGPTEVWVRGHRIERWASRRGLAILRYLLLQHPMAVHREKLMDLLWPRSSARSARNNLNVAMHGLRRTLEVGGPGPYVVFGDGSYRLAPDLGLWLDVEQLRSAWDTGHALRQAGETAAATRHFEWVVSLYRGELFADDTDGDWHLPLRRRLEDQFTESLELVASHAADRGDHVTTVELCHRLLEVDPCRETAHRLLMVAYASQGRHHLAARQYAHCVSSLQEHLDVAPHQDTTSTFLELLRSRS